MYIYVENCVNSDANLIIMSQYGVVIYIGILFIGQCSTEICKKFQIPAKDQIKTYERFVKKSQAWNKRDHILLKTWNVDFQLNQINLTAEYRMKVKMHKELSFKTIDFNNKWNQCVDLYKNKIYEDEESYFENESECLKSAHTTNNHELEAGTQLEKEIRKWRKSFKYLKNLCKSESPNIDENFSLCLVQYIQRDKFDVVFRRLRSMKLDFMRNIVSKQNKTLIDLEDCLKQTLSSYIDKVRLLKNDLNICYDKRNHNTSTEDSK